MDCKDALSAVKVHNGLPWYHAFCGDL
jgi:hypothetical protein